MLPLQNLSGITDLTTRPHMAGIWSWDDLMSCGMNQLGTEGLNRKWETY